MDRRYVIKCGCEYYVGTFNAGYMPPATYTAKQSNAARFTRDEAKNAHDLLDWDEDHPFHIIRLRPRVTSA